MEIISKYISEEFLYGIGWTIFHSIWIGAVISILLFVALNILSRASARLRYNISLGALISIVLILSLVFTRTREDARLNRQQKLSQFEYSTELVPVKAEVTEYKKSIGDIKTDLNQTIISFLNSNYDTATILWLIGILVMAFRFTGGIIYTGKQKKSGRGKDISSLAPVVYRLKDKLGIKRKVKIVESIFYKIPVTIGILKPVILIPVGALTGIPYNQVEAIIAHELAHIRRHDYLINIFQSLAEIILFYHPAIWWISSMIRNEREIACDDIAMDLSDEKITYIKALLSISELESRGVSCAVAFTGNNNNLLNRIKRITKMKHNKLNRTDKWTSALMSIIIVAGLVVVSGFTSRPGVDYPEKPITNITDRASSVSGPAMQPDIISIQDTNKLSGRVTRTIIDPVDKKEKDATFTFKDGDLVKLVVDGKDIPESDYVLYREVIKETESDMEDAIADMNDALVDIDEALEEIENIDFKEMEMEIQEALSEIEDFDMESIEMEIQDALQEIKEIDMEKIEFEMQEAISEIKESLKEIEEIDMKEIEFEMQKAIEDIKNIDIEKIRLEMMESMEGVKEIDLEKVMKEMEESIERVKESLKDIEIDQRKNFEEQKKNFEAQKKELEKQLIEIQEQDTQRNKQIKSEKKNKKEIFN